MKQTSRTSTVADSGEGPEGPGSPLIFRPNWDPKGRKKFFETAPPSEGLDPPLRPRRNQFTETMRQSNPKQKNETPPRGLYLELETLTSCHGLIKDKNALIVVLSLVCLKIRSRNEEAINSTRNRIYLQPRPQGRGWIYSLKVFYFLLYRPRFFCICFWIDLVRVLATTGNTSAVAGYTRV